MSNILHDTLQHIFTKEDKLDLKKRILDAIHSSIQSVQNDLSKEAQDSNDIYEGWNLKTYGLEPWPQQVITLYQPYEVEQILVPDNANCLAVQAFLKMCGLNFQIEPRHNAEYMSPSGQVPFIQCGAFLISEFENIVSFVGSKGISLTEHFTPMQKADMRAFMSLVNNVFVNAELYISWVDEATLRDVTKQRYGSVYPWPLNHFLNWQKRTDVIKKLKVLNWYNKTIEEVCTDVDNCCKALSDRLGDNEYFSGKEPTELDALVYGHVHALTICKDPSTVQQIVLTIMQQFPQLMKHKSTMHSSFNHSSALIDGFEVVEYPSKYTLWNCSESLETLPPLSEDSFEC